MTVTTDIVIYSGSRSYKVLITITYFFCFCYSFNAVLNCWRLSQRKKVDLFTAANWIYFLICVQFCVLIEFYLFFSPLFYFWAAVSWSPSLWTFPFSSSSDTKIQVRNDSFFMFMSCLSSRVCLLCVTRRHFVFGGFSTCVHADGFDLLVKLSVELLYSNLLWQPEQLCSVMTSWCEADNSRRESLFFCVRMTDV